MSWRTPIALTAACRAIKGGSWTNANRELVSLRPDLDRFLAAGVATGTYRDVDDAIEQALTALHAAGGSAAAAANRGAWPAGDGACAALVRAFDWASTSLGPIEDWSPQLTTTVSNVINSPVPKVLMWGRDHVMIYNDGYSVIAAGNHPRAFGGTVAGIWPEVWDYTRDVLAAGFRGEVRSAIGESMILHRNGAPEELILDLFYTPVYDADGSVGGVLCTVIDTTQRALAERALEERELELRTITDALPVLISYVDRDHVYRFANRFYEDWLGIAGDQVVGRHARDVLGEATYAARQPMMARALAGETIVTDALMPHRDGVERNAEIHYMPRIVKGAVVGFHVLVFDIQDRVDREADLARQVRHRARAEDQLRHLNENLEARVVAEIAERRRAEQVLIQAQKMETVGKLTGGVAHDFNNLLQVVSGNLQLLAKDVAGQRPRRTPDRERAGGRVARRSKLAAQLLAFGRRQALEPQGRQRRRGCVRGMDDMLRRAIGEGVEIETIVAGGLWNSFIDPAQIENALLNLAINARDAMDGHGQADDRGRQRQSRRRLCPQAHAEVAPGQYVMLAVTDTGSRHDRRR